MSLYINSLDANEPKVDELEVDIPDVELPELENLFFYLDKTVSHYSKSYLETKYNKSMNQN